MGGYAQNNNDKQWHSATVKLTDGQLLKGTLRYDFRENQVEFNSGEAVRRLIPNTFEWIVYQDYLDKTTHTLLSKKVERSADFLRVEFFEAIDTTGRIQIYHQYYWVEVNVSVGVYPFFGSQKTKVELLYTSKDNEVVTPLNPNKRGVLQLLKPHKTQIKQYAKENRLKYNRPKDIQQLIQYANTLTP